MDLNMRRTKNYWKKVKFEGEYNCDDCDFQTNTETALNKHKNLKHLPDKASVTGTIKCFNCDEQFDEHWNLMKHRKLKHITLTRPCKNFLEGKCRFTSEVCWWRHAKPSTETNPNHPVICRVCEKSFANRSEMMKHRKGEHSQLCRPCQGFLKGSCRLEKKTAGILMSAKQN